MTPGGFSAPYPCPPPGLLPTYSLGGGAEFLVDGTGGKVTLSSHQIGGRKATPTVDSALEAQANAVLDLIDTVQMALFEPLLSKQLSGMMKMDASGPPGPGEGGGGGGGDGSTNSYGGGGYCFDTNGLWLDITNVSVGLAFANLHNGTNYVYEIFTKTNLLQATWDIAGEVFPTDTNCNPFTVAASPGGDPASQFLWARDWTGITSLGNTVPEWWFWKYFGTTNLSDATLDSGGNNTLLYDYTIHQAPANAIQFTVAVTNNYVATANAPAQIALESGIPGYIAIAVDNTNYLNATNWTVYTSANITVPLGATEGWHDVWIGLCGHTDAASAAVWQWKRLKLDTTPPPLVITGPTNGTVNVPMIQLTGYSPEALSGISYDITNALGLATNQQVLVLEQSYSTNTWEFTTNTFQAFDIPLTNGVNAITLHATDLAGNTSTLSTNFTLDYSSKTNPPTVQITWPQNGTEVSGSGFTMDGQVADATVTVAATIADNSGNTNTVRGLVERNGRFWVQNLPLSSGTNIVTLTVTDAAMNSAITNITVVQSAVTMTLDSLPDPQQLWNPTVNLTGTISDPTYAVWVNGVKGHNKGDGTWYAHNVPTTPGGVASFTVTAYSPDETQPDNSHGN